MQNDPINVFSTPESEPIVVEQAVIIEEQQSPEVFYLFAVSISLLDWYSRLTTAENAQLPASMFYDQKVIKHENIIYVIAEQMGISTHALAGFLQLHQDEINDIIKNAELLEFGNFVKTYIQENTQSQYPIAEATTYYVWQRLGASFDNLNVAEWELLWQKVYRFFELTRQVEPITPDAVQRDNRLKATALLAAA